MTRATKGTSRHPAPGSLYKTGGPKSPKPMNKRGQTYRSRGRGGGSPTRKSGNVTYVV